MRGCRIRPRRPAHYAKPITWGKYTVRHSLSNVFLLALILCVAPLRAAEPESQKPIAKGIPTTIEVWNATPDAELTVTLRGGARFLGIEPIDNPAPWFAGVTFTGDTLKMHVPAGSVTADTYSTLRLRAYMELGPKSGGTVVMQKPQVFALHSPYGTATLQSGSFALNVPTMPPTCVLSGCSSGMSCPDDQLGNKRACIPYYSHTFCCLASPYPSIK